MTGGRFGATPNGNRAELPVFIQFTFSDDLIASERFVFDLSVLCAPVGGVDRRRPASAVRPARAGTDAPLPPQPPRLSPPPTR